MVNSHKSAAVILIANFILIQKKYGYRNDYKRPNI
jgi:hypothetical protein